jgi:hypothetical protein
MPKKIQIKFIKEELLKRNKQNKINMEPGEPASTNGLPPSTISMIIANKDKDNF